MKCFRHVVSLALKQNQCSDDSLLVKDINHGQETHVKHTSTHTMVDTYMHTPTGKALEAAVQEGLHSVALHGLVGDKLAGEYSGGMRRRLSVGMAFMGQPRVVYLDEPST